MTALNGVVLGFNRCAFAPANLGFNLLFCRLSIFSRQPNDSIRSMISTWLDNSAGSFARFVSRLNRFSQKPSCSSASHRRREPAGACARCRTGADPTKSGNADLPPGIGTDVAVLPTAGISALRRPRVLSRGRFRRHTGCGSLRHISDSQPPVPADTARWPSACSHH